MNIKIVDCTYPIFVLSVIYQIYVCRDLRNTNDLQDVALGEINKSLSYLMESKMHMNNKNDKIKESENEKSMNDVSSKNHSYSRYVSLIQKHKYRKSFNAANRARNKEANEDMQTKGQVFKKSRRAMNQESKGGDTLKKLKQKKDLYTKMMQLHRSVENRKLTDNNLNTPSSTTSCVLSRAFFPDFGHDFNFADTLQQYEENNLSPSFDLTVNVTTDDYAYEVGIGWTLYQKDRYDMIIDSDDDYFTSQIFGNTTQTFDYYCVVSYGEIDQINGDLPPTCFEFELQNYWISGMLTDLGSTSNVTMSINKNEVILKYPTENRTSVNTSFCIGFDDRNDIVDDDDDYTNMPSDDNKNSNFMVGDDDNAVFEEIHDSYTISSSDQYAFPSMFPSLSPSKTISTYPSVFPSKKPSVYPSAIYPSATPSFHPTPKPTVFVDFSQAPSDESQKIPDFETTCVLMKTEVSICEDDPTFSCSAFASQGYCNHIDYYQSMNEGCQKSCDRCPPPRSSDFSHETMQHNSEDFLTEFNLDMIINTDSNSQETSWTFLAESPKVTVVRSNESDATSQLYDDTLHKLKYSCGVSYTDKKQLNPDTIEPFCYTLEVHDSFGDGMCCDNGAGSFAMSVNNTHETLEISNPFYDGSKMELSFCIDNDGKIESETEAIDLNVNQPTYFPVRRMQCKKRTSCHCDSKPNLFTDVEKSDVLYDTKAQTLLGISMLSQPKELQDVESPQYKAACWVLFDDPYQYVSKESNKGILFIEEGAQKRMMERYAMAVLYFSTEPNKWKKHLEFLSSRSECEWRSREFSDNGIISFQGCLCDNDGNIISLYLTNNNLNGTIVEELSELKSLEVLDLSTNNIQGSIPSVLGQLSKLRGLHLSQNALEGAIHPNIFNADVLEKIELEENKISDTIPNTIGNLRRLSSLNLNSNDLSGSIPDAIYFLKSLRNLNLGSNKFSSSISPLVGNLKKLKKLHLSGNILSGKIPSRVGELKELQELILGNNTLSDSIPSTVGELFSLSELALNDNQLTGEIPESLFNLPSLRYLKLQYNDATGSIPDHLCEIDGLDLQADCQNDIFEPQVSCSCCTVCNDETPIWDGECADSTIKIVIDRKTVDLDEYSYSSDGLEWSLINAATEKKIPLKVRDGMSGGSACVAFSDCISIDMVSQPIFDTYFQIYWNDVRVEDGIRKFPGSLELDNIYQYKNTPFQYDEELQELTICRETELLICHDGNKEKKLIFDPKSPVHISFSKVTSLFGRQNTLDYSSHQSKALCWVLLSQDSNDRLGLSDIEISQRFVLTILHLKSQNGLFGDEEYPPESHECEWPGIHCTQNNNTRVVTGISLSSEHNQIINGTLIEELGGLQYLEILEFDQTQLHGTIPKVFSNLWSLKKLSLSGNRISGTIPSNLFHQLDKLQHIDISNNQISGSINDDIGSFSYIRFLDLSGNQLTGTFPLHGFNWYYLEHLDISGNELRSIEFAQLIKHTRIKTLDLSDNFFVGSLPEDTFTSLTELQYVNISQNEFSGTIPSAFPELSNITHFDTHMNKLKGLIPLGIKELFKVQYINLQGNQLIGSLPDEINQLKSLNTLVLSHNMLKGSIPFDSYSLQHLNTLHLHGNMLSGDAPRLRNMTSYITDCGFPSDLSDPVSCPSCSICCNSIDRCRAIKVDQGKINRTLMFSFSLIGFLVLSYLAKNQIISIRKLEPFFSGSVSEWNALTKINDKSVYHFLLTNNKVGWKVAVGTGVFQILTLFLFVVEASSYSLKCPYYSLKCEDTEPGINATPLGLILFGLILVIWLSRDLISSVKLLLLAMCEKNIDILFTGGLLFFITALAAWTSIYYNLATVTTDHELIVNTVILLFVLEADERIYQLAKTFTPQWVIDEARFRQSAVFIGDDLIISSSIRNFSEFLQKVRNGSFHPINYVKRKIKRKTKEGNVEDEECCANHEKNLNENLEGFQSKSFIFPTT